MFWGLCNRKKSFLCASSEKKKGLGCLTAPLWLFRTFSLLDRFYTRLLFFFFEKKKNRKRRNPDHRKKGQANGVSDGIESGRPSHQCDKLLGKSPNPKRRREWPRATCGLRVNVGTAAGPYPSLNIGKAQRNCCIFSLQQSSFSHWGSTFAGRRFSAGHSRGSKNCGGSIHAVSRNVRSSGSLESAQNIAGKWTSWLPLT